MEVSPEPRNAPLPMLSSVGEPANVTELNDDIFAFINAMCGAIKQIYPDFNFSLTEYIPFAGKDNFVSMLAGALICCIENTSDHFVAVIDDLDTIQNDGVKKLIAYLITYLPKNAKLCFGSREAPWQHLLSLKTRGDVLELTQKDLAFTRKEAAFCNVKVSQCCNVNLSHFLSRKSEPPSHPHPLPGEGVGANTCSLTLLPLCLGLL